MLDRYDQPSLHGILERMNSELSLRAALLLRPDGQIISRTGMIDDSEFPTMAALVAAAVSAGASLGGLFDADGDINKLCFETNSSALYALSVNGDCWLAAFYDQPLNPALLRMRLRRYGETLAKITSAPPPLLSAPAPLPAAGAQAGSFLPPVSEADSSLFENITDQEIDKLFDEAEPEGRR